MYDVRFCVCTHVSMCVSVYVQVYAKHTRRAQLIFANESIFLFSWLCYVTSTKKYCRRVDVLSTHESCQTQHKSLTIESRCCQHVSHATRSRSLDVSHMNETCWTYEWIVQLSMRCWQHKSLPPEARSSSAIFKRVFSPCFRFRVLSTLCMRESSHLFLLQMNLRGDAR